MKRSGKAISGILALLMAASLSACGGSKAEADKISPEEMIAKPFDEIVKLAKEEGELSFWVWGDEAVWQTFADKFTEKYGINVEIMVSDKNTALNKVLAEKDGETGSIDVMGLPGDIINGMMEADVLYGKVLDAMPDKDLLDQALCDRFEGVKGDGQWVPIYRNQTGMLYNAMEISEDELPQTWEELTAWIEANPKKFGFCIPEKGGSGQSMMQTVITCETGGLDQYMNDTEVDPEKTAKWDAVWNWINEHKEDITFTNSNSDSISRLNQGEITMTVAWDASVTDSLEAGELFKEIGFYIPEFGLIGGGDVQTVLKNAPHPAAGLVWLSYISSSEGQELMMDLMGNFPIRSDMELTSSYLTAEDLERSVEWMPAIYKQYYIDEFIKNVLAE